MQRTRRAAVLVVMGLALASGMAMAGSTPVSYRVVAKTGDAAPGTAGTFLQFGYPRMNDHGEVAFDASLSAVVFPSGVWSEGVGGPGNLALVVREGTDVPGSGGTLQFGSFSELFFSMFSPEINDAGNVAFGYRITGPGLLGDDDVGIARQVNGALQSSARPSQIAPGMGGATFGRIMNLVPFNANNEIALVALLEGPGINANNNDTMWRVNANNSLSLVAREGAAVPGAPGFTYSGFLNIIPVFPLLGDDGHVSLAGTLTSGGVGYWSLLRGPLGAPSLIAQQGQVTPLGAGTAFEGAIVGFGRHELNDSGDILFPQRASINGQSRGGLWRRVDGVLQAVAVEGQPSSLGNAWDSINSNNGAIGKDGRVVFRGNVAAGGSIHAGNDSGLFLRFDNAFTWTLAREGQQAPGLPPGVTYADMSFSTFEQINERGQIVFNSAVTGPGVNASNDVAVWATNVLSGATLIVRKGSFFQVAPGDSRQVESIFFVTGAGAGSGDRPSINRLGQIAMRLTFTDDTEAIVVAELPNECFGDIDGDLEIDFADLNLLIDSFNDDVGVGGTGDLDLDGDVDFADLNLLLSVFNTDCNPV